MTTLEEKKTELLKRKESLEIALSTAKEATPEELWDRLTGLEDQLEEIEDQIEELEDEIFAQASADDKSYVITDAEALKSFYQNAVTVAKTKGLPEPEGKLVKMNYTATVCRNYAVNSDQVKKIKSRTKYPKTPEDYRPDEEDMGLIHQYSNTDLKADGLYCYPMKAWNQLTDRGFEHPAPKALASAARMTPDKPVQIDHNHSVEYSIGKMYLGKVHKGNLIQKFYVLDAPEYSLLNRKIQAGIINKVSVGFGLDPMDYVCDSCNKSMYDMNCKHYPGMLDEKGNRVTATIKDIADYYETSVVAIPMVPAAGIRRNEVPLDSMTMSFNVDRIVNDKTLSGDKPVMENENQATEQAPVVTPEVTTPPAAPEEDVLKTFTNVISKLNEAVEKLAESLKDSSERQTKVEASIEKMSELINKALEVEVPELTPQAQTVLTENSLQLPAGQGGILNSLVKALSKSQS